MSWKLLSYIANNNVTSTYINIGVGEYTFRYAVDGYVTFSEVPNGSLMGLALRSYASLFVIHE